MKWLLTAIAAAVVIAAVVVVVPGDDASDAATACAPILQEVEEAASPSAPKKPQEEGVIPGVSLEDAERCNVLQGLTRQQAARVVGWPLHRRDRHDNSWLLAAGETNGYLGPPDATYLVIRFGPSTNRVTRTSYP